MFFKEKGFLNQLNNEQFEVITTAKHTETADLDTMIIYRDKASNQVLMMFAKDVEKEQKLLPLSKEIVKANVDREFKENSRYDHYKNKPYISLFVAVDITTGKEFAIYKALYGTQDTWARPLEMFLDKKLDNGVEHIRFQEVNE